MDVISEVIGSVRAGQAFARGISESGTWGMRFPAFEGVGFHVVRSGSGWLITSDREPIWLRAGDIVLATHGTGHGLSSDATRGLSELPMAPTAADPTAAPARSATEPTSIDFLCGAYRVGRGQIHHFLRRLPDVIRVRPDYDRHRQLVALVELLADDVTQAAPGTGVTRSALVDLLLVHAMRVWQEGQDERGGDGWPAVDDAAVATALREIHQRPQAPWTVHELSKLTGVSRSTLTRRFTESVGKPPKAYLIGWRLLTAARLLRESNAPLAAVARQVGYSSEFAFASAFRREFGISPGRFRDSRNS